MSKLSKMYQTYKMLPRKKQLGLFCQMAFHHKPFFEHVANRKRQ